MQVGGVSLDMTLIMHEQTFGDFLTGHSFLSLESVGCRTGYTEVEQRSKKIGENKHGAVIAGCSAGSKTLYLV